MKSSQEYAARVEEIDALRQRIEDRIKRMERIYRRLGEKRGRLCRLEDDARSVERDGGLLVHWVKGNPSGPRGQAWTVAKVTNQTIFVHQPGFGGDKMQFMLDGTSRRQYGHEQIDIQTTFGVPVITAEIWKNLKK